MPSPSFAATAFIKSGGGSPCRIRLEPHALVLEIRDDLNIEWPYADLTLEHAGNEDEYLLLKSAASDSGPIDSMTIRDVAFNEALATRVGVRERDFLNGFFTRHRKSVARKWRNLAWACVVFLLLLAGGYGAITFWAADWTAKKMPISLEVKWGRAISKAFLGTKQEITEGPAFDAAQILFSRLKQALPKDNPYPLELHVVKDPIVNAFALPGGQVVLMTGLMEETRSPEEVAGVLAHEIQHVLKRHVVKRLVQELGWRAWFSVFVGGGDLSGVVLGAGSLMQLSYGRAQESEADREGAHLLREAGLSVRPLADFFERLSSREGADAKVPAFISTHPESLGRAKELAKLAATPSSIPLRPLTLDWVAVQKTLK